MVLRGRNLLTLIGWILAPPVALFSYYAMWGGIRIHGPANASFWPYLAGLFTLFLCGVLGVLAQCGVGGRDKHPIGCIANGLLAFVGGLALWAIVYHLNRYGLP